MDRGDQYLSINTKFIGVWLPKSREGVAQPPLVGRVTKKEAWLNEGYCFLALFIAHSSFRVIIGTLGNNRKLGQLFDM